MAPSTTKVSYRTYEAQARLVRAIVAAHPGMKWDYKEIVACYGSDMTEHALNHRFRHIRAEALIIEEGRKHNFDMKNLSCEASLPGTKNAVNVNEIAKYFGQSTPDGIQFQFRSIKKDAEKLRQVEAGGGDVASALSSELCGGTTTPVAGTPSKPTPRRRGGPVSGSNKKRTLQQDLEDIKREGSDDEFDSSLGVEVEQTPSKRLKADGERNPPFQRRDTSTSGSLAVRTSATPSRSGRVPESFLVGSQSPVDRDTPASSAPTPKKAPVSLFGPVSPKAHRGSGSNATRDDMSSAFNAFKSGGIDAYVGSQDPSASIYSNASFSYNDGEI